MKLAAYLDGIGLLGPGLDNWPVARPILKGDVHYASRAVVVPAPQSLPPAERRRTGTAVKVALARKERRSHFSFQHRLAGVHADHRSRHVFIVRVGAHEAEQGR